MSTPQNHFFRRESRALIVIALVLFACAALLTIGLILAGYTLVDVAAWFVRVTGG
jgi:hypothetical protein